MKIPKFPAFIGMLAIASGAFLIYKMNETAAPSFPMTNVSEVSQTTLSESAAIRQAPRALMSSASSAAAPTIQPSTPLANTPFSITQPATQDDVISSAGRSYPASILSTSLHDATGIEKLSGLARLQALRQAETTLNPLPASPEPATPSTSPASANDPDAVELTILPGAILPAGFYDESPRPEKQTAALNRILMDFHSDITTDFPGMTEVEVWESARQIADARYKVLFGAKAFNERHLRAAKEALTERKALNAATTAPSEQSER